MLSRQYETVAAAGAFCGVAFYRYGSLFAPQEAVEAYVSMELYNLEKLLP